MSKKHFLINLSVLVILVTSLTGCSLLKRLFSPSAPEPENKKEFSLKDALTLGKSVECTYTTDGGEVKTWIKGNKIRAEGAGFGAPGAENGTGGMINDGEWIYVWGGADQKGTKYRLSTLEAEEWQGDVQDWQDIQKWAAETEERYKIDCRQTLVSDAKFAPPSDVEFQNLTEIFGKTQGLQKSLPTALPAGELDEEQLEELQNLMDQFQPE